MSIVVDKVLRSYGEVSWGELPNFKGNYINYGYWEDIPLSDNKDITLQQRIASSYNLYKLIANKLNIQPKEKILEIGCGRAPGLLKLAETYNDSNFFGIDVTPEQIERANVLLLQSGLSNVNLHLAAAESPSFEKHFFDKAFSIEALQHFVSVPKFIEAMAHVLKPGGKLCISTYLSKGNKERKAVEALLPLIGQQIEEPLPINEILSILVQYGFKKIQVIPIGQNVFYGYERWNIQAKVTTDFSYNYYKAYQANLVEYYIIEATLV